MSPESYLLLKQLHRASALLTICGFVLRWVAGLAGQAWVRGRVARSLPHAIDTVLLSSALALAYGAGFTPFNAPWLATKILALLLYIGLGMLALSPRRPQPLRLGAGAAALLVFAHIVAVAITKQPAGIF